MILIADSGSTKTNWCSISSEGKKEFYTTDGINPYFRTREDIVKELKFKLVPKLNGTVKKIWFYGAGIINTEVGKPVLEALSILFTNAVIEINSDLLAAARSTLQNEKGIACILGTGSNSCLYDGDKIVKNIPPLGFILGDEGSGAVLGRKLLADFLKGILPKDLSEKFQDNFSYPYSKFLQKVYKEERPNAFLASLVPFIRENIENIYCKMLVENSFREFFLRNISLYENCSQYTTSFVGSIAFYFSDILKKVVRSEGMRTGVVVKDPMEGLIIYHLGKERNLMINM